MCIGNTLKTGNHGRVHVYPYIPEDPTGPVRTDQQTREAATTAHSNGTPVSVCVPPLWEAAVHLVHGTKVCSRSVTTCFRWNNSARQRAMNTIQAGINFLRFARSADTQHTKPLRAKVWY